MNVKPSPAQVKAGKIAARILRKTCDEVKPGASVHTICRIAEQKTIKYGGIPAFPCNICIDQIAAHYTSPNDGRVRIPDSGLVKVDIGVHVDGYIADTARTIDVDGTLEGFVAATDDALDEAINLLTPGLPLGDVGKLIEKTIKAYGLRPIKNLSGHSLKRYKLHAGKTVPNVKRRGTEKVEIGDCYAIEPFATNGTGTVIDSDYVYIFANTGIDKPLEGLTEKLRLHLRERYGPLPFASRWIGTSGTQIDIGDGLKELLGANAIRGYSVQVEKKGRLVAQSEHTVFISSEGPMILTKPD
jgi:methionyl aminopeptidase